MEYRYYYFGSEDSLDRDVLIDHPGATGTQQDSKLADALKEKYPICKDWDINIIRIENGYVTRSTPIKGSVDSVNNALFQTYDLHKQVYELPVAGNLPRNILMAIVRCIREILVSVKKTPLYNDVIRYALRGNFSERIEALEKVSYSSISHFDLENQKRIFKRVVFRLGQTLSLFNGIEIYTKRDFKTHHPDLAFIIDRTQLPEPGQVEARIHELYQILKTMEFKITGENQVQWNHWIVDYDQELEIN